MQHKWVSRIVVLIAIAALLPLLSVASAAAPAPGRPDKVDPVLWQSLVDGTPTDMVVEFAEQADLSAAYGMDWEARGEFVVRALTEVARHTQAAAIAAVDKQGLRHQTFIAGNELYVFGTNLAAASELSALPNVARVRAPVTIYLDPLVQDSPQPEATTDWGISDTKANEFWTTFGVQGEGIVVANIDTGVQYNHPALASAFKCPGAPNNAACWRDPSNICGSGGACDNNGHGTHTMGTMVADDNANLPYIAGMAPNAKWIACKGCESSSCSDFALNTCADWILSPGGSTANRPHVVNNSWGGGGGNSWYLSKVQAWQAAGIFPAFSAGNSTGCGSLGSPGDYQVSFGTTGHSSSRSHYFAQGPSATFGHTPYTKPNISAPGVSICSTVPTDGWNCGYSGTSMASPHSAGAVALLWSCNPDLIGQMGATFEALQNSADAPSPANPACGVPPDGQGTYEDGYGYLNVLTAGQAVCGGVPPADTMHVQNIALSYTVVRKSYTVKAEVLIVDQDGGAVPSVTVTGQWTLPRGSLTQSAVTNAQGVATFTVKNKAGTYRWCATDLTKTGYIYVPGDNVATCDSLTVP